MSGAKPSVAFTGYITGRVQGVGFRFAARRAARDFEVRGWVRNISDGRLEFHAEGAGGPVSDFMMWLEQGPPAAQVEDLDVLATDPIGADDFEIR